MARKNKYTIETSNNYGLSWIMKGGFEEGQPSRFNEPMSQEVAIKEAQSYKEHFKKGKSPSWLVRVTIEI